MLDEGVLELVADPEGERVGLGDIEPLALVDSVEDGELVIEEVTVSEGVFVTVTEVVRERETVSEGVFVPDAEPDEEEVSLVEEEAVILVEGVQVGVAVSVVDGLPLTVTLSEDVPDDDAEELRVSELVALTVPVVDGELVSVGLIVLVSDDEGDALGVGE